MSEIVDGMEIKSVEELNVPPGHQVVIINHGGTLKTYGEPQKIGDPMLQALKNGAKSDAGGYILHPAY
jgi:hypothetical protein